MKGKAKRTNKKSATSDTAEQQTLFEEATDARSDESTTASEWTSQSLSRLSLQQPRPFSKENRSLPNEGLMLVDATCAPADVAYPTDLNLLNEAREKLEAIIDTLHEPVIGQVAKPRTYREKAPKQYLAVSKQRRPGSKVIRKAIRRQLGYVGRDLEIIARAGEGAPANAA